MSSEESSHQRGEHLPPCLCRAGWIVRGAVVLSSVFGTLDRTIRNQRQNGNARNGGLALAQGVRRSAALDAEV